MLRLCRMTGLYVASLYVILKMAVFWAALSGYGNDKTAAGTLAISICILALPVMCFYKAFRSVTVFLVIAFQAFSDISSYIVFILMDKPQDKLLDMWGWRAGRGMIISEKVFVTAVKASTVGMMFLQY